ncbi:MAG: hypothetical protein U9R02_05055 [Thermodesulfobacteriota bacterium]|nr:hypothetical protein [Thermodesulfobacteriota bacterium]
MIEIIPHSDSFRGSYHVPSVVDTDAYLYIYNEVFVENWNQYIKKMKAGSYFIKSKWFPEESEPANGVSLETLSREEIEMVEGARKASEFTEHRRGKKGRYFQKLVDHFDRERKLIICHNPKFYTYEIETKFADHISIYLIEESEITSILNHLYLRIRKGNRVVWRQRLFRDFETDDED